MEVICIGDNAFYALIDKVVDRIKEKNVIKEDKWISGEEAMQKLRISGQLNMAKLGSNLDVSAPTAKRYLELLEDLLLIRSLRPWSGNVGKRLVKTPKIYIRDSGLTHALLNLTTLDDVLGHPVVGSSWEGYIIENLISCLPVGITPWFYRTSAGAEIDLVIEQNSKKKYAIEIKRSLTPSLSKGFHLGCEDIEASSRFIVYPGKEKFAVTKEVSAMPLPDMMNELREMN